MQNSAGSGKPLNGLRENRVPPKRIHAQGQGKAEGESNKVERYGQDTGARLVPGVISIAVTACPGHEAEKVIEKNPRGSPG